MVQLLNLVAHNLAAPTLHNAGFAVSILCVYEMVEFSPRISPPFLIL